MKIEDNKEDKKSVKTEKKVWLWMRSDDADDHQKSYLPKQKLSQIELSQMFETRHHYRWP